MSNEFGEKIKMIREAELLTRRALSQLTGIAYTTLSNYEGGINVMSASTVKQLLKPERLHKYALWFTTDQVAPEAGQIAPDLSHIGQGKGTSTPSGKKTG